jgi:protocatechuate 3,4-dioxygenase beta subunit
MKIMSEISRKIKSGRSRFLIFFLLSLFLFSPALFSKSIFAENSDMVAQLKKYTIGCRPTPPDALGPFYKPNAPLRNSVGKGYELNGKVLSSKDCAPIKAARIELWMAGPDGEYRDDYRATVLTNESGEYRFESHMPPSYARRPPHIHIRVTADGFNTLSTQHYPAEGSSKAEFNLILIPIY